MTSTLGKLIRGEHAAMKPTLCLDFDGVLHSYSSGWQGADVVPDPPTPGAMQFLDRAVEAFDVAIYSSRSHQENGILAMRLWLDLHLARYCGESGAARATEIGKAIQWPTHKPAAMITIDDRALTFTGAWPNIEALRAFQPWNKIPAAPPADPGTRLSEARLDQIHALTHAMGMSREEQRELVRGYREYLALPADHGLLLTGVQVVNGAFTVGFAGGPCEALARAFCDQFDANGGINDLAVDFLRPDTAERFTVTIQRCDGKTPHRLREEAEAREAAVLAKLEEMAGRCCEGNGDYPESLKNVAEELRALIAAARA